MITTSTAYSPECVEGVFCEVGLPLYGVLRNSHQTWATGIMLVGERARPAPALRTQVGLRSPRAEEEAMDAGMGAEANTTRFGALAGAAMMALSLVRRIP